VGITFEDRLQLLELGARAAQHFDSGDGGAWASLFTAAGVFSLPGDRRFVGTEQLAAVPPQSIGRTPGIRHFPTPTVLDEVDGEVRGRSYVRAYQAVKHDELTLLTAGEYQDTYSRDGDRWKFQSRSYLPWADQGSR